MLFRLRFFFKNIEKTVIYILMTNAIFFKFFYHLLSSHLFLFRNFFRLFLFLWFIFCFFISISFLQWFYFEFIWNNILFLDFFLIIAFLIFIHINFNFNLVLVIFDIFFLIFLFHFYFYFLSCKFQLNKWIIFKIFKKSQKYKLVFKSIINFSI